jgi:signal transduction histidine kinase
MSRARPRSISGPIVLSAITVALTFALIVSWLVLVSLNTSLGGAFWSNRWLLAGGIVSLVIVMSVVVMFSVFLMREILEVRRQQTFIDSVTHELKSPLASIKLCLDTLMRSELSDAQRENLRQMMLTDVERLSVFVDDILEASRIAHGRHTQSWTAVSIPQLVRHCIDGIQKRYNLEPSAFQVEMPADLTMTTDPSALETVLKNLLDNAVKYSPSPPRIDVSVRPDNQGQVELQVTDHGIGIEKAQLKRIFRRFYRVPNDEVYARSGTGLGLYVVAALVRNLGGHIEAHSLGPNQGTSMRVHLPLGVATAEATP